MAADRLEGLNIFVRAAEAGSFTAAARTLELTPSAVSKAISRLEDRLGVRLLNRTTRSVSLTGEGERLYERAQRILADLDDAEQEILQARAAPRGLLRMHVSVAFGLHQLPPVLPDFLRRYPEVEVSLTISDRIIDPVEEGIDLAVRIGRPTHTSLVARRVCDLQRVICAAPSYLKRHGTPRTAADLAQHNCLQLTEQLDLSAWPFDDPRAPGGVRTVHVKGTFSANNAETLLQMAVAGIGIVRLADLTVAAQLRSGELVPILTDQHHFEPIPLYILMPPGRHRLPKVRVLVDFLIAHFEHAPWRVPLATATQQAAGGAA